MEILRRIYWAVRNLLSGAVIVKCPKCGALHRADKCRRCGRIIFHIDPTLEVQRCCHCDRVFQMNGKLICGEKYEPSTKCDGLMQLPKINRPVRKFLYKNKFMFKTILISSVVGIALAVCLNYLNKFDNKVKFDREIMFDNKVKLDREILNYTLEQSAELANLTYAYVYDLLPTYDQGYVEAIRYESGKSSEDLIDVYIRRLLQKSPRYVGLSINPMEIDPMDISEELKKKNDPLWQIYQLRCEIRSLRDLRDYFGMGVKDISSVRIDFDVKKRKIRSLFDQAKF